MNYVVTRDCCMSGNCTQCAGSTKATPYGISRRVMQYDGSDKKVADQVLKNYFLYNPTMATFETEKGEKDKPVTKIELPWRCHTPNLLKEIALIDPRNHVLGRPLQIFGFLMHEVATRASELNDPALNNLMCRLTLYDAADPESPSYDPALVKRYEQHATEENKTTQTTEERSNGS